MAKEKKEVEIVEVDMMGLVRVLMQVKSAIPASINAITEEKMNKTNNPFFERVTKQQDSNVFINFDYSKAVNKRLEKEATENGTEFVPHVSKGRVWGEHLPGTCIVFHKGEYYLETGFLTNNKPKVNWFLDGEPTDKAVFETFIKPKPEMSKTDVILRDFKMSSIRSVKMNGKIYVRTDV